MPVISNFPRGGGSSGGVQLSSITISGAPTKTSYLDGDTFDPTGLTVTAHYTISGVEIAAADVTSGCSFSPNPLMAGVTEVELSYNELGVTKTETITGITVKRKLDRIVVTTNPTKMTYEYGDNFATAGMAVTAYYKVNGGNAEQSAVVTGWTINPTNGTTLNDTISGSNLQVTRVATVTYVENGITKTTTLNLTITRKTVAKPTWKTSNVVRYNDGSNVSVTSTTYWDNFNTSYMTISGDTASTVGAHTATFTCKDNYRFDASNSLTCTVDWEIVKALGQITAISNITDYDSSTKTGTLAIDASNYSAGVACIVTRKGSGAVTAGSANNTAIPVTYSGTTVTIKGDGTTAGTYTVTINVAADSNYEATTVTITVTATYWEWDAASITDNTKAPTGDASWWSSLKAWVASASDTELEECLGKQVTVTLNTAVQGTTTHRLRCIGWNCDRDKNNTSKNTLTFHASNCFATNTAFGSSNALWASSTVRSLCQSYKSAIEAVIGTGIIVTTSQKTATTTNSSQSATATAVDETVFLPSDAQMGFPKGKDYNNGEGYAASYDEFDTYNTSKTAYQYYTNYTKRIKYDGDSGSSAQYYWERSLSYDNTKRACYVCNDGRPYNYGSYSGSRGFAPAFVI